MKSFVLKKGLWVIAMLELIPGVWRIGYAIGKHKAEKSEPITGKLHEIAGNFIVETQSLQSPIPTTNPEVGGMVGGQGGGKTHFSLTWASLSNAYHINVNDIRFLLEERDMDQGNARYIAFEVAARLVSLGYSVIVDMSHDLAFTRGYMEQIVRMFAGNYSGRLTFSYAQNETTWGKVRLENVFSNCHKWYGEAAKKRFPGLTGVQLRISEAEDTHWRFYWPNGSLIRRRFPGLRITTAEAVAGISYLTPAEVDAMS